MKNRGISVICFIDDTSDESNDGDIAECQRLIGGLARVNHAVFIETSSIGRSLGDLDEIGLSRNRPLRVFGPRLDVALLEDIRMGLRYQGYTVLLGQVDPCDHSETSSLIPLPAERLFEFLDLLLPKRLCDEDLSDACEEIASLATCGASSWRITLKTLTTIFWCLLNGYREIASAALGRRNKS